MKRLAALVLAATLATASPAGSIVCVGDCTGAGGTQIGDLQSCVNILLNVSPLTNCRNCDADGAGLVDIGEVQQAVNSILFPGACPVIAPAITVGSGAGGRSMKATVPVSIRTAGESIVTLAPLEIVYDPAALALDTCTSTVAGKIAYAASPEAGRARVVVVDDVFGQAGPPANELTVFPSGTVVNCTFDVSATAPIGVTPVTFAVGAVADSAFNDIALLGSSGAVTIQ